MRWDQGVNLAVAGCADDLFAGTAVRLVAVQCVALQQLAYFGHNEYYRGGRSQQCAGRVIHTMYVVGQKLMPDSYFGGYLTVLNLTTNSLVPSTGTSPNPVSISDGFPGATSRMIEADDNTLWIGMTEVQPGRAFLQQSAVVRLPDDVQHLDELGNAAGTVCGRCDRNRRGDGPPQDLHGAGRTGLHQLNRGWNGHRTTST